MHNILVLGFVISGTRQSNTQCVFERGYAGDDYLNVSFSGCEISFSDDMYRVKTTTRSPFVLMTYIANFIKKQKGKPYKMNLPL